MTPRIEAWLIDYPREKVRGDLLVETKTKLVIQPDGDKPLTLMKKYVKWHKDERE